MSILETLGQKLEVLLSIFCGTKINLEWITPPPPFPTPPIFRSIPTIMPYPTINIEFFFNSPINQNFEDFIAPVCNWGIQTM